MLGLGKLELSDEIFFSLIESHFSNTTNLNSCNDKKQNKCFRKQEQHGGQKELPVYLTGNKT